MPHLPPEHAAALNGDLPLVQALIDEDDTLLDSRVFGGTFVDDLLADGCTPLMMAGYANAPDVVAYLVEEGAELDCADASGCQALHWACISNARSSLLVLLARGCDPDARDDDGWPPLFVAIDWGAKDCARHLISLPSFDAAQTDLIGYTALHYAAMAADADMVQLLLKRGADPTLRATPGGPDREGAVARTPLESCLQGDKPDAPVVAAILEQAVADAERARTLLKARALLEAAATVARLRAAAADEAPPVLDALSDPPLPMTIGVFVPPALARMVRAAPPCLRYRVEVGYPLPEVTMPGAAAAAEPEAPEAKAEPSQPQQPSQPQEPQQQEGEVATAVEKKEEGAAAVEKEEGKEEAAAAAYKREQLNAVAAWVVGLPEQGAGLLPELHVELMEMLVPEWDRDNC